MKKPYLTLLLVFSALFLFAQDKMTTQEYIAKYKDDAIKEMKLSGVPASITLAQGILESGSGNSKLAREANNHFGIKCHGDWEGKTYIQDDDKKDECFRKYKTVYDSYKDHSYFLSSKQRYAFLFELKITDYKGWAKGLKKAGYATNPKYARLLINIIERYELYQYDDKKYKPKKKELVSNDKSEKPEVKDKDYHIVKEVRLAGREVKMNNRVQYVVAKNDDSVEQICRDLEMMPWQIYKYNNLEKNSKINKGQVIYIKPKRSKNKEHDFHIAKKGETLYNISHQYAVKLKKLCKYNALPSRTIIKEGQKIWLRKPKR